MIDDHIVIIGFGSIGKRHAHVASSIYSEVVIYDPPQMALRDVSKDSKEIPFRWVNEIPRARGYESAAVISNWGPDHFTSFRKLVALGYKKIIVEKPMVNSLSKLNSIKKISVKKNVKLLVNQGWVHTNLAARIGRLSRTLELGEVQSIFVNGGARCHSTGGSHVMHLALEILDSRPEKIMSLLKSDSINPRDKSLLFLEGVTALKTINNKFFSISYTNNSRVAGEIILYWKEAVGILYEENIVIHRIESSPTIDIKITRYESANLKIFEGEVPTNVNMPKDKLMGIHTALNEWSLEKCSQEFVGHFIATRLLIMFLITACNGKSLNWNQRISPYYYYKNFRIS